MSSAAFSLLLKESLDATPPGLVPPTAPINQSHTRGTDGIVEDGKGRRMGVPALSETERDAMTALMGMRVVRIN